MLRKLTYKQLLTFLILIGLISINVFLIHLLSQIHFYSQIIVAIINVIIPFLISFIIVYIFHPILYWIEKKFSIKTWVSSLTIITLYTIFIIFSIDYLIPLLAKQLYDIINDIPHYIDLFNNKYAQLAVKYPTLNTEEALKIKDSITNTITINIGTGIVNNLTKVILFLIHSFWLLIIIPTIIFIMMVDYPKLIQGVNKTLSRYQKSEWMVLLKNIDRKLGAYIRGQLIIITYMFVGTFIPLFILGMPDAFVFSIIIAITNIIPYIGPYIGGIPLCLYAYFQSPMMLVASLIIILVMQQFDGNIGQPLVYGKQLKIHPIVVIIVMLVGGAFGGVIGLVSSVPLFIILGETYKFFKPKLKNPQ